MKVEDIIKLTEAGYTKADVAELLKAEEPDKKEEPEKKEEAEKEAPDKDLKAENEKLRKQIEELQKANRAKELPGEPEDDSDGLIKRLFG